MKSGRANQIVIPAKAGIQQTDSIASRIRWIPAFAGMTMAVILQILLIFVRIPPGF
jgi:hypothetical protein